MKSPLPTILGLTWALCLGHALPACADSPQPNQLTPAEKAAGWRLLFDGHSFKGWHLPGPNPKPGPGWVIEDGILKKLKRVRGGNLLTDETFEDFELAFTWRLPDRGNNGVKYFVDPKRGILGHEYQLLGEQQGTTGKHATGAFYDVLPPKPDHAPFDSTRWNHSRILVHGNHVEHWLNGEKILEYELCSPEVLDAVAHSKFRNVPRFGCKVRGHIMLTDHGDAAWFKDIKIRVPGTP
ncbi:MAG: DUF1080 domain-containing protein [Verrucomicrobia bacterium]|nr:MAG: DUF1080 domain-containing protein [Verrucomicrobiota bacterium]